MRTRNAPGLRQFVQDIRLRPAGGGEQHVQIKFRADDARQAQQLLCSQSQAAHPLAHNRPHTVRELDRARDPALPAVCTLVHGTPFHQSLEQFLGEERIAIRSFVQQGHTLVGHRLRRQVLAHQCGCAFKPKTG